MTDRQRVLQAILADPHPGTYDYHCTRHPRAMRSSVVVRARD